MAIRMQYDVEGAWQMLHTCNYRCDYCFLTDAALGEKIQVRATPAQWRSAFDDTGKIWLLHLTGGEPSHYPGFADLCALLAERHYLSLNSNLTGSSIAGFAERVEPSRVSFINAGLHPTERARKQGHAIFLRHVDLLANRGFPVMVTVVATPEVLESFEQIIDSLRPVGLVPFTKLLQIKRGPRRYPRDYTARERHLFRHYSSLAERTCAGLLNDVDARPSIDPTVGRDFLHGTPDYRRRLCSAGLKYVKIEPDGRVERCGNGNPLGNLLDRTLQFASGPVPCDRSHCFYVCEKYTKHAAPQHAAPGASLIARMRNVAVRYGLGA